MKKKILFLTLLSLLLAGCSGKKATRSEASVDLTELDETPIEEVEADSVVPLDTEVLAAEDAESEELVVEDVEPDSIFDNQDRFAAYNSAEDEEQKEEILETEDYVASSELTAEESEEDDVIVNMDDDDFVEKVQEVTKVVEKSEYIIQKNDTLMMVAWKIYGDTSKWRELENLNQDKIHNGHIWTGEKLVFERPEVDFEWSPEGSPYLINKGDTLSGISKEVYDKGNYWQAIWYNNRDLIRNPDLIFAGFTIYYQDLDQINHREIASKIKLFEKQK